MVRRGESPRITIFSTHESKTKCMPMAKCYFRLHIMLVTLTNELRYGVFSFLALKGSSKKLIIFGLKLLSIFST